MFDVKPSFDFASYPYDFNTSHMAVEEELMIFHCHHYNTFLQRSIQDADYLETRPILVGGAAEVAHAQLSRMFRNVSSVEQRRAVAEDLYRLSGFGLLPLSAVTEAGGEVRTPSTHYSLGWKEKFGPSREPVALFSAGWLAGAFAAIYDVPLQEVDAEQTACVSMGAPQDVFRVRRAPARFSIFPTRTAPNLRPVKEDAEPPTTIDRKGITRAVSGLPLLGNDKGIIPAFGVYLTRMYADYYNRVSFAFEKLLVESVGLTGVEVAQSLLIEAGRVCSFHTFGGIMTSTEWDALILPTLQSREDWIYAIVSVVNALGWGTWKVMEVGPERGRFRIYNDYESVGYERMYGQAAHGISYLATGGVAGLMNLVYLGDIMSRPDLTPAYYQSLFKGSGVYQSEMVQCQAQGHNFTEIVAYRS